MQLSGFTQMDYMLFVDRADRHQQPEATPLRDRWGTPLSFSCEHFPLVLLRASLNKDACLLGVNGHLQIFTLLVSMSELLFSCLHSQMELLFSPVYAT